MGDFLSSLFYERKQYEAEVQTTATFLRARLEVSRIPFLHLDQSPKSLVTTLICIWSEASGSRGKLDMNDFDIPKTVEDTQKNFSGDRF